MRKLSGLNLVVSLLSSVKSEIIKAQIIMEVKDLADSCKALREEVRSWKRVAAQKDADIECLEERLAIRTVANERLEAEKEVLRREVDNLKAQVARLSHPAEKLDAYGRTETQVLESVLAEAREKEAVFLRLIDDLTDEQIAKKLWALKKEGEGTLHLIKRLRNARPLGLADAKRLIERTDPRLMMPVSPLS